MDKNELDIEGLKVLGKDDQETTWEVIIKNSRTGKEAMHHYNVKGGAIIIAQGQPEEKEKGGTRQILFGALPYVLICYYKSKYIFKQTLIKFLGEEKFNDLNRFDAYKDA